MSDSCLEKCMAQCNIPEDEESSEDYESEYEEELSEESADEEPASSSSSWFGGLFSAKGKGSQRSKRDSRTRRRQATHDNYFPNKRAAARAEEMADRQRAERQRKLEEARLEREAAMREYGEEEDMIAAQRRELDAPRLDRLAEYRRSGNRVKFMTGGQRASPHALKQQILAMERASGIRDITMRREFNRIFGSA